MDAMIGLGSACLLVRLGQALYGTGLIRAKNAAGSVLRAFADLCVAALAFWAIGAAILVQTRNGYFSVHFPAVAFHTGGTAEWFFLTTVVLIGTAIPGGALAERSRFFPVTAASLLLAGLVIPVGANWAWTGWLHRFGFIDAGGATWLHTSGALCATVGAILIGPRTGKYHRDGSASMIPGHNLPLAGAGALAMLVGWVPYLVGCLVINGGGWAAASAASSILLGAAAGGLAAMLLGNFRYGKPEVILTLMGFLGGLVAMTAGAERVTPPWAVLIGAVAGVIVPLSAVWIELVGRIDDPVGVIAVHGVGGVWGTLAAGFFVHGSALQRLRQTGVQLLGIIAIAAVAIIVSSVVFGLLRRTVRLRAGEADEYDGLDLAEHDIGAYPDFQQNMIKSYHLRET